MKRNFAALTILATIALPGLAMAGTVTPEIAAALASPDRPEADRARDESGKTAEVLAFAGIKPGMTVLDVNSGGGYHEEILSRLVGPKGKVYAHNDTMYTMFASKRVAARGYGARLPNVVAVDGEPAVAGVPDGSVDVAIMVMAYHDFFAHEGARKEDVDFAAALASIKKALKPGGSFVVIDHAAGAGSSVSIGNSLHRIDPALVRKQIEAAGFRFAEESNVLRNPDDAHTENVFAPGMRGKTDRFVFRFMK